jgi:hypothetical protein
MGTTNMAIACLGTVLGFATSAVVAEVRGRTPEPRPLAAISAPKQFRPAFDFRNAGFTPTAAPALSRRTASARERIATRSIVVTSRTAGVMR